MNKFHLKKYNYKTLKILNIFYYYFKMSLEKMNMVEEVPQNDNEDINNNNESESKSIPENNYSDVQIYTKNFLHLIINTLINFGLIIIIVIEFILRGKNSDYISNYDFLILIFIVFGCIFIVGSYVSSQNNFIKGMVYYPFVTCFWGLGDFLSPFILNNMHNWNNADTLKIIKFSLIALNVLINIIYIFFCKNK